MGTSLEELFIREGNTHSSWEGAGMGPVSGGCPINVDYTEHSLVISWSPGVDSFQISTVSLVE